MPRAILTYNLPREQDEYRIAMQAPEMASMLWTFQEWLRREWNKHGEEWADMNGHAVLERVLDRFNELTEEYHIRLE